ncbi:unnamed protein product [Blepharisma stoltei]|uniref:Uncharacterized protein n=1 Tax=Blepharisma stoltei TaxID=1481888 RepID=A0AAU9JP32_9CILI|nr:unnamed protein product [Blepharisma stoltei]
MVQKCRNARTTKLRWMWQSMLHCKSEKHYFLKCYAFKLSFSIKRRSFFSNMKLPMKSILTLIFEYWCLRCPTPPFFDRDYA